MIPLLNLLGRRTLPLLRQSEAAECGLACVAMVAGYHGYETDLSSLRQRFPVSLLGTTLSGMVDMATGVGLAARGVRLDLDELPHLRVPAILHWDLNHFVVLRAVRGKRVDIHDPAIGARRMSLQEVSPHFTGVALELVPTGDFRVRRDTRALKLGSLAKLSASGFQALWQAVTLSLVIEVLVLATPFYMQLAIDDAVPKGDEGLLVALAVAFALLTLFNVVATTLRALVLQVLSNTLSFEMETRLFHHLVRLPLEWFHKRHVGDIQSRFASIGPIKNFIANGAIAAVLDGVLGVVVLVMLFLYSTSMAWIVLCSLALYAIVRASTLEISRRVAGDYLIADAKKSTRFLEALRAAQTIKVGAHELERDTLQRNLIAATLNASIRAGNVGIAFGALNRTISGGTDVLVVFLGAYAVIQSEMSVGMLTAFIAYKSQFATRVTNLIENIVAWRLLDVHLQRIADIALQPRESQLGTDGYDGRLTGAIEFRGASFKYAPGDAPVIKDINLRIDPGEYVAVTGQSGCGKSTLLKILVGLYAPTSGEVLIDGRPLSSWNKRALRRQIGVVMQDDRLLQGSIAENIAGFDEHLDMSLVEAAARSACIHEAIMRMPMGYRSLVGDMGSTLSGGQRQRVLIARALYRNPRVLVLDEGTSQLDIETERGIHEALSSLAITRVIVAHRPETVRAAGRVLQIYNGRAVDAREHCPTTQGKSHA